MKRKGILLHWSLQVVFDAKIVGDQAAIAYTYNRGKNM